MGAVDAMVKSFRSNRSLMRRRKRLKDIYQENGLSETVEARLNQNAMTNAKALAFKKKLRRQLIKAYIFQALLLISIKGLVYFIILNYIF